MERLQSAASACNAQEQRPRPDDSDALLRFLDQQRPRWIELWIERDRGIPGRGRPPVPTEAAPAGDYSREIGRDAVGRVRRAFDALSNCGFAQRDLIDLYRLAEVFDPKSWRTAASATVSKVASASPLRSLAAGINLLGTCFFPEDENSRAPRDLVTEARKLLLRAGLEASEIAVLETVTERYAHLNPELFGARDLTARLGRPVASRRQNTVPASRLSAVRRQGTRRYPVVILALAASTRRCRQGHYLDHSPCGRRRNRCKGHGTDGSGGQKRR